MSDILMLNKKRSIICSLIPESPIGSPSTSRKPILASYFASITVSELLKFLTSLAAYASLLLAAPTVAANATTAAKTIPNTNITFPFLYFKFNIILFLTIFQCYPIFNLYLISNTSLILNSIINLFLILTFQS